MIRLSIGGLLLVSCGLLALIAWELGLSSATEPTIAARPHVVVASRPVTVADHTDEWVATILDRPLFSPDRRPPSETQATKGAAPLAGLPRLSAVLVGPFGRSAIFAAEGQKPMVVLEGSRVGAWTVRSIEDGAVEVIGPGGPRTLHPSFESSPSSATQWTPMPGAPIQAAPMEAPPTARRVGLALPR